MAYVSFNKSTTRLNAKTSGITGKVYFTNDSPTIVLDGKEYGITSEIESTISNLSTQITTANNAATNAESHLYAILGTLNSLTGEIGEEAAIAADIAALLTNKADKTQLNAKIDKPSTASNGNIAVFNSSKNVVDGNLALNALSRKLDSVYSTTDISCKVSGSTSTNTSVLLTGSDTTTVTSFNVSKGTAVKVTMTNDVTVYILKYDGSTSGCQILATREAESSADYVYWLNNSSNTVTVVVGVVTSNVSEEGGLSIIHLGTDAAISNLIDLVNNRYEIPNSGIPKADLANAVLTSLGKADSSLQSVITSGDGNAVTGVSVSGSTVTLNKGDMFAPLVKFSNNNYKIIPSQVANYALANNYSIVLGYLYGNDFYAPLDNNNNLMYGATSNNFTDANKVTPNTSKLYYSIANDIWYRWNGSSFIAFYVVASLDSKADKVSSATSGHLAGLDSSGNLTDSGKSISDFATSAQGAKADSALQSSDIASMVTIGNIIKTVTVEVSAQSYGILGSI